MDGVLPARRQLPLRNLNSRYRYRRHWAVRTVPRRLGNRLSYLLPGRYPPKDGMPVVEMRRRGHSNEKLAAVGAEPGLDYRQWFRELADRLGMEVVVTDDAVEYAGLKRQQCMVPRQRTLGWWKGRRQPGLWEAWGELLAPMS